MIKTFKILSALLSYPSEELAAAAGTFADILRQEKLLKPKQIEGLARLIGELTEGDLYDNQERYVLLFDRTRSLSLHLFEHVHGESRDRGQAMVDLNQLYEKGGLFVAANELPDYLPLFLEFLSTQPVAQALELIGQPAHIFAAQAERLRSRQSAYAGVFSVLARLAKADPKAAEVRQLLAEPEFDPNDLEALDAAWEDEEVRFGPTAKTDCGVDGLAPRLRAAGRPAPGMEDKGRANPRTVFTHDANRNS